MGLTYTYATGQITRDFHLLKPDGKACPKSNLPPGVHCFGCEHYGGKISEFNHKDLEYQSFISCKLPGISDDKDARWVIDKIYEKFEIEALSAL